MGGRELDAWMTPRPKPTLPSLDQTSTKPKHRQVVHRSRRRTDQLVTLSRPSSKKFGLRPCQLSARKTLPFLKFATINIDLNQAEGHALSPKAIRLLISNKLGKVIRLKPQ